MRFLVALASSAWWVLPIIANVEKTIFLAPEAVDIYTTYPGLDQLALDVLRPSDSTIQTDLAASFPTLTEPFGNDTWLLLEGLKQYQRHEVRVCWAAIQPTSFTLETFTLSQVFDTPELISALATFSYSRHESLRLEKSPDRPSGIKSQSNSVLFLRIFAAADYFSTDSSLMQNVPPVKVDIILDPFLLNVFPRSLRWTAVYLVALAVLAWYISDYIWQSFKVVSQLEKDQDAPCDDGEQSAVNKKDI